MRTILASPRPRAERDFEKIGGGGLNALKTPITDAFHLPKYSRRFSPRLGMYRLSWFSSSQGSRAICQSVFSVPLFETELARDMFLDQ